jgi:catechol 2,3-dioxygenase-like lactoylglutathione lyase family enzyme
MDCKIELIFVPVTDVDRARDFYVDQVGFTLDHDVRVDENIRFVQLTPVGSACSIAFGDGIGAGLEPGQQDSIQVVVASAEAARAELISKGVDATDIDVQPWGIFTSFTDPDGNRWTVQELPER